MRSRESLRRERRIAARMAAPVLLLAGDPGEVLEALREDAAKYGIPVVDPRPAVGDPGATPAEPAEGGGDDPPPTIAVVIAQVGDDQSSLRRGAYGCSTAKKTACAPTRCASSSSSPAPRGCSPPGARCAGA